MRPLRAFPFPINIGTDICQISRIHKLVSGPRGARFIQRVLTPEERQREASRLAPLGKRQDGVAGEARDLAVWKTAAFIAGRFAAKEAAIKAHTHRRLTFHDVVIERRGRDEERLGSGPPVARIRAQRREEGEGEEEEDVSAMISISHDGDYATAVCLSYDPSVIEKAT